MPNTKLPNKSSQRYSISGLREAERESGLMEGAMYGRDRLFSLGSAALFGVYADAFNGGRGSGGGNK